MSLEQLRESQEVGDIWIWITREGTGCKMVQSLLNKTSASAWGALGNPAPQACVKGLLVP